MVKEDNKYDRIKTLCEEPKIGKNKNNNSELNNIKNRYKCWIFGFIISILPILGLTFFYAMIGDLSGEFLKKMFSDSSIMFISVTTCVSLMYEYILSEKCLPWLHMTVIIFASFLYTGISIASEKFLDNYNFTLAIVFNIIFIIIVLARGYFQYKEEIRGVS